MCTKYTDEQVAALRFLIFRSKDGADLTKRIMAHLISESAYLSRAVCLTLIEGRDDFSQDEIQQAANGFHDMNSLGFHTHLTEVLYAMGSDFTFSYHYGDYDPMRLGSPLNRDGMFPGLPVDKVAGARANPNLVQRGLPLRYTFWLCNEPYSSKAALVWASATELNAIDLGKPGLYPDIENQEWR